MVQVIYRRLREAEAQDFWEMMNRLDRETKFMMYEPGERRKTAAVLEAIGEQIRNAAEDRNFLLAAEADGQIIGFLSAQRGVPNRIRHTAYIVVGIREGYRRKGIGKRLFQELDLWAGNHGIKRLELTVICGNEAAKRLYESNGFTVEGIKEKSMFVDGSYVDEYYMAKIL